MPQSGYASGLGTSLFKGCTNLTSVYLLSDTPPVINDFTYTPARFVAENLGCDVEWEAEHKTVIVCEN